MSEKTEESTKKKSHEIRTTCDPFSCDQIYKMTLQTLIQRRCDDGLIDDPIPDDELFAKSDDLWSKRLAVPSSEVEGVTVHLADFRKLVHRLRCYSARGMTARDIESIKISCYTPVLDVMKKGGGPVKTHADNVDKSFDTLLYVILELYSETLATIAKMEILLTKAEDEQMMKEGIARKEAVTSEDDDQSDGDDESCGEEDKNEKDRISD